MKPELRNTPIQDLIEYRVTAGRGYLPDKVDRGVTYHDYLMFRPAPSTSHWDWIVRRYNPGQWSYQHSIRVRAGLEPERLYVLPKDFKLSLS